MEALILKSRERKFNPEQRNELRDFVKTCYSKSDNSFLEIAVDDCIKVISYVMSKFIRETELLLTFDGCRFELTYMYASVTPIREVITRKFGWLVMDGSKL